jgi:hypothetical protein
LQKRSETTIAFPMPAYPKSPKETTRGMMYFPRMLDKIRLHARGELHEDSHRNFGSLRTADSACCNFLPVHHLNEGDLLVWNGFVSKLGWRDFATPTLEQAKKKAGIFDRDDIATIPDLIDFDEDRFSAEGKAP